MLVSPADHPGERGKVALLFEFTLRQDAEVELLFDPGNRARDTRDWMWLRGPLVIE